MEYFYYFLYYFFAANLPHEHRWKFIGRLSGKIRKIICRRLFAQTDKAFSVGKGVDFGYLGHLIVLADHANLGNFLKLRGNGGLTVGKHVMMGEDITIITQNHKYLCPEGYDGYIKNRVVIGDYAWIGDRTIILQGVTIGMHSIIGAGSVVTKSIPPYSVAVGNPARIIKSRKESALTG